MRLPLSLSLCLLLISSPLHAQVKVWEGTLPVPASDEGPLDTNPNFDTFADLEVYPYPMRLDIRGTETVHAWHALYLENEYLKCTILPQVGGHLDSCVDKINGQPMFSANPVFKKAIIAYRGAWAAFGEEFNFPVSHNWVSISPVDWSYSTAADGSASVTVGNRDRVYGMDWSVEIILRPGSTLLEERVTLTNHNDERHHFFWWNNAGVQVWNDSRIYYPMQLTGDDGLYNIDTWPVNLKGKDLSLIANQTDGQFSWFAYGSKEPFMGVYSPHTDSGVVHWADPAELPAKKIFAWGLDANAADFRKRLSDNDTAYVEVQSGLFRDQATFEFLQPRQSIRFTEYWMPVRGIGSIARANLSGVLALTRKAQPSGTVALTAGFNANHAIPKATITVSDADHTVYTETISLDPAITWQHTIPDLPANKTYTFLLADSTGKPLLQQTENVYDVMPRDAVKTGPQPQPKDLDPKTATAADYLAHGNDVELGGDYLNAYDAYRSGLAKSSADPALLKAAGRLADHLWHFDDAVTDLNQAEAQSPADTEIHYYRAIAEEALGHTAAARTELEAARTSPSFRAAAGLLLAELIARSPSTPTAPATALKTLQTACPTTLRDQRCVEETVALLRASNDPPAARALVAESLPRYPLSLFLRNEAARLNVHPHSTLTLSPLDQQLGADTSRILALVLQYNRLGLFTDSLDLLTRTYPAVAPENREPNAPLPSNDPLLAYYRGYLHEKLGQSGTADYAAAAEMPLLYIFPSNYDDFAVFHAALAANPSDASAHYLLGNLFFAKGLADPALDQWKQAEAINPHIPALQATIGRVLLEVKKQPTEAAAELQRGLQLDPGNYLIYNELDVAMVQLKVSAAQRAAMLATFPDPDNMNETLARAYTDALHEEGKNAEADAFYARRFLHRKEGVTPLRPQD